MSVVESLNLDLIKVRWNAVLDLLESKNRTAWLVYFDARLVFYTQGKLHLSFADAAKLGGAHDFSAARKPHLQKELEAACLTVFGVEIEIVCE